MLRAIIAGVRAESCAVSAMGICSFRNGGVQSVLRGQGKSVWVGPEVCQDVAQGHTSKYCVTLRKSPTLSDPQVPDLRLRKNVESMPQLLLHWDWILKPLRLPWPCMRRALSRLFSKVKMVIGKTDVTRDILSRKELFLGTLIWWKFSEHGPASQHSWCPQRALMCVITRDQLLPFC